MKLMLVMASVLVFSFVPVLAAGNPGSAGANAPAPKVQAAPVVHKVLAVVGGTEITSEQLDKVLSRFADLDSKPPEVREKMAQHYLQSLIAQVAIHKLLEKEKVQCSDAELTAFRAKMFGKAAEEAKVSVDQFIKDNKIPQNDVVDRANLNKIMSDASSKEKVAAFVKENPDYFNGTKVRASHILILSNPMDPSELQLAARKKLEDIAANIQAGKISFEDAAKESSDDTVSKKDGGDVKEFTFAKMVPGFSAAAFKLKKGDIGPIVHTEFGFHLIKVTDRTQGSDAQDPKAEEIAQGALRSQVGDKIINMAVSGECPIQVK